ncbi:MAG: GTP 3',8-cyclase MoaA [Myxococcales bacterium]|nr:GTP 3',8-cyclase MoaA [Myxococcales bacterium]
MSRLPVISTGITTTPSGKPPHQVGIPGWLSDRYGRQLRYLRLSVTDRCDLTCKYCMPEEGIPASPRSEFLSFEEIVRLVRAFRNLGVSTVRLTGGEPLVRKDIEHLVGMLRDQAGITDIAMTSNGSALAKKAKVLVENGLQRINVSLDSLDALRFQTMTRGGKLERVLHGLDAIQEAGVSETKINTVVVRDFNHNELANIVDWAWSRHITPRFIELMPLGEGARLGREAVFSVAEMKAHLCQHLELSSDSSHDIRRGPAYYLYSVTDPTKKVGFIGAVTDNFCAQCNRVRLTPKGEIRACLASPDGISLKELLRTGAQEQQISEYIASALFRKGEGHEFYTRGSDQHHQVDMSSLGG